MDTSRFVATYVAGVIADVLFLLGLAVYNSRAMSIYKNNLQKIGVIYNPSIELYYVAETPLKDVIKLRFRKIIPAIFSSLLSWLAVLLRINSLVNSYTQKSKLPHEQSIALDVLKKNPNLSEEEVRQRLKEFDEHFYYRVTAGPGNIPIVGVDSKEFSHLMAHALLNNLGRKVFTPILFENDGVFTWREAAILKFVLGEIGKDELLNTIEEKTKTERERDTWHRQVLILTSALRQEGVIEEDNIAP